VTPTAPLDTRRVLRTWWPLAASWLFMSAELPLLSGVVARMPEPAINLAAYGGVVFPLALIIESPVIMLLAASTALSRDTSSYRKVWRYMMAMGAALTALQLVVVLTPLYYWVASGLLGAPAVILEPARIGLLIMTPWTWSIAYRRFNQGVLIRYGRSRTVGVGTAIRLGSVTAMLALGYRLGWAGIVVATAAVAVGVFAEAVYIGWIGRPVVAGPLAASPRVEPVLTRHAFSRFYVPLMLTSLLVLIAGPIGSAALSRMPNALASLAVWPVVSGLLFMLRSAGMAFNEVVVALVDEPGATGVLRRFAWLLMLGVTFATLAFAATPLSLFWFGRLTGLEPALAELARTGMWLALPLAALTVLHSWYQGVLVNTRRTRGIVEAVALYLVVIAALLGLGVATANIVGLYVGLGAMTVAAAAQAAWLWHRSRSALAALDAVAESPVIVAVPELA
jgi:hypothetical protein